MDAVTFTPLYDWVAKRKDLTLMEKILICRILRWGDSGCWEKYSTIARFYGVNRCTVIRAIKSLVDKEWLLPPLPDGRIRILYINPEKLTPGPLFPPEEALQNATKSAAKCNKSAAKCARIKEVSKNISDKIVSLTSKNLSKRAKPLSKTQFERQRQKQLKNLFETAEKLSI